MFLIIHDAMQKECSSSTICSFAAPAFAAIAASAASAGAHQQLIMKAVSVFCEQQNAVSKVTYSYPETDSSYAYPVTETFHVQNP